MAAWTEYPEVWQAWRPCMLSSFGDDAFSQEMRDALIDLDIDISPSLVTSSMRADSYLAVLDYREMVTSINQMKLISSLTQLLLIERI